MRTLQVVLTIILASYGLAGAQTPVQPTADQCLSLHQALDLPEYRETSERWRIEGISRYQGRCYPRDAASGIAALDRAVRMDNARAAMDMAILSAADGTAEAAAAWRWMATMAVFGRRDAPPSQREGLDDLPRWLTDEVAALKWAFEREDVPALLSRVRELMMRPPYMPKTEWRFVAEATEFAMKRESFEAFYLFAVAALEWAAPGEIDRNTRELGILNMRVASACGFPDAIRRLGQYMADDRLPALWRSGVIERVWWLHDQTGQEGELLARLAPGPRHTVAGTGEDVLELDLRSSARYCSSELSRK
jgi:hypothetical protein